MNHDEDELAPRPAVRPKSAASLEGRDADAISGSASSPTPPDEAFAVGNGGEDPSRSSRRSEPTSTVAASRSRTSVPVIGYRGPTACSAAGVTYRQLDYWARTGLVVPSVRGDAGSRRLYSFRDILKLRVIKRLLDTGVSLQDIRVAIEHLRERDLDDLEGVTLFSDGHTIYECTSPEEIVDLLQSGRGVFGIAIGGSIAEVGSSLVNLPVVQVVDGVDREVGPGQAPTSAGIA